MGAADKLARRPVGAAAAGVWTARETRGRPTSAIELDGDQFGELRRNVCQAAVIRPAKWFDHVPPTK